MMVEKIVQKESDVTQDDKNLLLKLPKHRKQIGDAGNNPEIYIEDYAEGYLKRLTTNNSSECRVAVLVGEFMKSEGKRYVFIRGAIEVEDVVTDNKIRFSSEAWAEVYEKIKRYFPYYEAVGWFLGGPGYLTEVTEEIRQIHVDWFGGRDRVLFRMDALEKEASFYLYEQGELKQWPGYSVYYEKNDEMQDYLVAGAPPSVDAGYKEPILEELGKKVGRKPEPEEVRQEVPVVPEEKPEESPKNIERQGKSRTGHGTGAAVAVALLAVGAFFLREQELAKGVDADPLTPAPTLTGALVPGEDKDAVETGAKVQPTEAALPEKKAEGSFYEKEFVPVTDTPAVTEGMPENTATPDPESKITPGTVEEDSPESGERIPTAAPEPETEETDADMLKLYIVQGGDTLAGICRTFYGDTKRMEEVKGINQIWDENLIYAGQELYLP